MGVRRIFSKVGYGGDPKKGPPHRENSSPQGE